METAIQAFHFGGRHTYKRLTSPGEVRRAMNAQRCPRSVHILLTIALVLSGVAVQLGLLSGPPEQVKRSPKEHRVPSSTDDFQVAQSCPDLRAALQAYVSWRKGNDGGTATGTVVYGRLGGGIGDRMPSIVSTFSFALRYRRMFFVDYPSLSHWLQSPYFDWSLTAAKNASLLEAVRKTDPTVLYSCEISGNCIWSTADPEIRFPSNKEIHHLVTNRGLWVESSLRPHLEYFNELTDSSPACLHHALLRPTPKLLERAEPYLKLFRQARASGSRVIGVHYRSGDASMTSIPDKTDMSVADAWTKEPLFRSTIASMAACLEEEGGEISTGSGRNRTLLFFISDSSTVRQHIKARFGDRVIQTDITARHVGNEKLRSAGASIDDETEALGETLTEWWLLSQTDLVILSLSSGFARTAVVASNHGAYMAAGGLECRPDFSGHRYPAWQALMSGSGL
jgi:hypothetical protein